MSLARIEIEEHGRDRWHAEVEVGGMVSRRQVVNARSFDELMAAVAEAYHGIMGVPSVVKTGEPEGLGAIGGEAAETEPRRREVMGLAAALEARTAQEGDFGYQGSRESVPTTPAPRDGVFDPSVDRAYREAASPFVASMAERSALIAEAEALGVPDLDRRWGAERLREAIAKHRKEL